MAQEERAAKNEAIFRDVNEQIKDIVLGQESEWVEALCECSEASCVATIDIRVDEYEAVRAEGTRFALIAGHEDPGVECVVERTDRFLVVEKIGAAADVARELDPRS